MECEVVADEFRLIEKGVLHGRLDVLASDLYTLNIGAERKSQRPVTVFVSYIHAA